MGNMNQVRRYFQAWTDRDADAILVTFGDGGTYQDPATGGPIKHAALRAYVGGLWSAFPDLTFAEESIGEIGPDRVGVTIDPSTSESTMRTCSSVGATVGAWLIKCGLNGKRGGESAKRSAARWKSTLAAKRDGMPVCLIGRKKNGSTSDRVAGGNLGLSAISS
jgi:SnoaL-like domain